MSRRLIVGALLFASAPAAEAFGPEGHLIAGYLAEPLLCAGAREEIAALDRDARTNLGRFAELGLWADRIRSTAPWQRSSPWHYMNIESDAGTPAAAERAIRAYTHPADGDVLWAIERFSAQLTDPTQSPDTRADALRFLVHFVVDVHQPLHVGLASDRGGNTIDVRYGATVTHLHRFWDTDAVRLRGLPPRRYARVLTAQAPSVEMAGDPATWAAESLLLRARVYAGLGSSGVRELPADYLQDAQAVTERRLVQAGHRLAGTLNRLFCR